MTLHDFEKLIAAVPVEYFIRALASTLHSANFSSFTPDDNSRPVPFAECIRRKTDSVSRHNTRRGLISFLNNYNRLMPADLPVADIRQSDLNRYAEALESRYGSRPSVRIYLSKFMSVYNFAVEEGLVAQPVKLRLPRCFQDTTPVRNLSDHEIRALNRLLASQMSEDKGCVTAESFPLALFMLHIHFQGLAPVDMASLRVGDVSFAEFEVAPGERERSVVVDTARRKTGCPVRIVCCEDPVRPMLDYLMNGKSPGDYLLPCYDASRQYAPAQRQYRLANFYRRQRTALSGLLARRIAANKCVGIDAKTAASLTYYYARHAYCNLMNGLDIPVHIIRTLVGHRHGVLERSYLRPLADAELALLGRALARTLLF